MKYSNLQISWQSHTFHFICYSAKRICGHFMLIITKPSKAPVIENLKFNYQHKNRKCGIKKEVDFRFSAPLYDLKRTLPASPLEKTKAGFFMWRCVLFAPSIYCQKNLSCEHERSICVQDSADQRAVNGRAGLWQPGVLHHHVQLPHAPGIRHQWCTYGSHVLMPLFTK